MDWWNCPTARKFSNSKLLSKKKIGATSIRILSGCKTHLYRFWILYRWLSFFLNKDSLLFWEVNHSFQEFLLKLLHSLTRPCFDGCCRSSRSSQISWLSSQAGQLTFSPPKLKVTYSSRLWKGHQILNHPKKVTVFSQNRQEDTFFSSVGSTSWTHNIRRIFDAHVFWEIRGIFGWEKKTHHLHVLLVKWISLELEGMLVNCEDFSPILTCKCWEKPTNLLNWWVLPDIWNHQQ